MTWVPWSVSAWLRTWPALARGTARRVAREAAGRLVKMGDEGHELGTAKCIRETPKAIIVVMVDGIPFGGEEVIPQSQVHDDSEVYGEGHVGKLVVTSWLAEQRGWDEDGGPRELDGELRFHKRRRRR
jgi:hypothetical protein